MHKVFLILLTTCFLLNFITSFTSTSRLCSKHLTTSTTRLHFIPKDIIFEANQIEIIRVLGKIEVQIDKQILEELYQEFERFGDANAITSFKNWVNDNREAKKATTVRVFEARIPGGNRCFVKEYLPVGYLFGKRELSSSRKLVARWNELLQERSGDISAFPPIPLLLGSLRTDERILDVDFRRRWSKLFPSTPAPAQGNLWLLFRWDESTFKTFRSFPNLPQVVDGMDYFLKRNRTEKRWKFLRKILRKSLEALDFLHKSGYCHNSLSSDSMWLTTTDQKDYALLDVRITDLGSTQKTSELGPYARPQVMEDIYALGFIFLQLVISSFCDRNNEGAKEVRAILAGSPKRDVFASLVADATKTDQSQLSHREFQRVFESLCDADFQTFRLFIKSVKPWSEGFEVLELEEGAGWKLIFKMLARGRLVDPDTNKALRISGSSLVRDNEALFKDTFL